MMQYRLPTVLLQLFEQSIQSSHHNMSDYNADSLREGIEKCLKNIVMFNDAIKKEEETIVEYNGHIKVLAQKAAEQEVANRKVEVVRE